VFRNLNPDHTVERFYFLFTRLGIVMT